MSELFDFLNELEKKKIFFQLNKIRDNSILVEISVPGQKWEVEFMLDGSIEVEKFFSTGKIYDKNELNILFKEFSD